MSGAARFWLGAFMGFFCCSLTGALTEMDLGLMGLAGGGAAVLTWLFGPTLLVFFGVVDD